MGSWIKWAEKPIVPKMAGERDGTEHGSSGREGVPERSRLKLLALVLLSVLLGGSEAQCSFMTGDQKDDKEDKNTSGAPAGPA